MTSMAVLTLASYVDWVRPEWAAVAAGAVLPLVAALLLWRSRLASLRVLAEPRHLGRLFPGLRRRARTEDVLPWLRRRSWLRAGLGFAAALLLAISFLGPVRGFALVPVQQRRIDVVLALDTSRSMLVEDVAPNRLARAKAEIGALLDVMEGERFGLVAFAGSARAVTPLTRDLETSRFFLERLSPDDNRKGGTDLGGALRLALARFQDSDGANEAIVLVTDGEDLTGEGLAAAEEAAARGVRIHVLGMGTEGGGKIPDGSGGFVVDPDAAPSASGAPAEVISTLAPVSLRRIAEETGGIYLAAKGRVLPLEELYRRAIAPMKGRDIVDGKERVPRDRYQWPLALAILALLVEGALRDTREIQEGRPRAARARSAAPTDESSAPPAAAPDRGAPGGRAELTHAGQ